MKVLDFLCKEAILLDLAARDKESAINEMVNVLSKLKKIKDPMEAIEALMQREKLGSTGIGQGVAIPHAKSDTLKEQVAVLALSKRGVDFDSLDAQPVQIFFLLLCPRQSAGEHLLAIAGISRLLKDKHLRDSLCKAQTSAEVLSLIHQAESFATKGNITGAPVSY